MTDLAEPSARTVPTVPVPPADAPERAEPTAGSLTGPRRVPGAVLLAGLVAALVVAALAGASIGAYHMAPGEILGAVGRKIGFLDVGPSPDPLADSVLWEIRFPRVALAVLVGASLGCAGAAMQGTFTNPLAEPGIVGVSSGAALGAVAQIVLGFSLAGTWTLTVFAFVGGLLTVVLVYVTSRADGRTEVVTLIITGIAVNAFSGAVIGLLTFFSDDAELRSITFWSLGSLAQATWPKVAAVAPLAVIGLAAAVVHARKLDLLALGERSAHHLGVDVERLRLTMMAIVAVLTAASVAVSGIILFVGLVVPHLVRPLTGPDYRWVLPFAVVVGPALLLTADVVGRLVARPGELEVGLVVAFVGAPVLIAIVRRTRTAGL